MPEDPDRFDSVADFYGSSPTDPLQDALQTWDHNVYVPLQDRDPELHMLITNQLGTDIDILVGTGSVKLGRHRRHITLTWNGDDEDLFDLVVEGVAMLDDGGWA